MFSLQDLIRGLLKIDPTAPLQSGDWIVAIVGAVIFLAMYKLFLLIIFHGVNKDYARARTGAWTLSIALAIAWLGSILEVPPLGPLATMVMLIALVFVLLVNLIYLVLTRPRFRG